MKEWIQMTDEIGPEKIMHVYDPGIGMKGVVVIDSTPNTFLAAGGIRMMPDITTQEIAELARAMTYKNITLEIPVGGAKNGIWADPSLKGEKRKELMCAFGRAIKPLLETKALGVGADIGTDVTDIKYVYEGAGVPQITSGLSSELIDGEPLENHSTGYGVVISAQAACEFAGLDFKGASVAIEGFGKAGGGVARYVNELGGIVTAISTIDGAIYKEDGFNIKKLIERKKEVGDQAVREFSNVKKINKEDIFSLPVDILIPGARPYAISEKNVNQIQAKIISSIANIPITAEAEEVLFQKGIHVVPDFISNAGGVVTGIIDGLQGNTNQVFKAIDIIIGEKTTEILKAARDAQINPRKLAIQRAVEKIRQAHKEKKSISLVELMDALKQRMMSV